jgi:hypothetical protein
MVVSSNSWCLSPAAVGFLSPGGFACRLFPARSIPRIGRGSGNFLFFLIQLGKPGMRIRKLAAIRVELWRMPSLR